MHGSAGGSGTQPSACGFSSQGSIGGSGSGSPMSPGSDSGWSPLPPVSPPPSGVAKAESTGVSNPPNIATKNN